MSRAATRDLLASLLFLMFLAAPQAQAYSVLTHEAVVDASWPTAIRPLLLRRFPGSTAAQLHDAHAYCYGGAIIQDMGYYPFGNKFFSDLVHYTRSGDFVAALLRDARNVNEYAFALGALAHYSSDIEGHPLGINRAVPMLYAKLERKFGPEVTYEDDPGAHLKTEFGFDVIEIARGQYAPEAYHDFIGFNIAQELLERAFQETYSISLQSLFPIEDLTLGTFRYSVSQLIPQMSKTAWAARKTEIQQLQAGITRKRFVFRRISRSAYRKEWNEEHEKPGPGARFLAFLLRLLPKIGPLRALAFKIPTPAAETIFITSFEKTVQRYRLLIADVSAKRLRLENDNFDIGTVTKFGEYHLADKTYEKLLERVESKPDTISRELRADILAFYGPTGRPASKKAQENLAALRNQEVPAGLQE